MSPIYRRFFSGKTKFSWFVLSKGLDPLHHGLVMHAP
jgi:hypothetical protein